MPEIQFIREATVAHGEYYHVFDKLVPITLGRGKQKVTEERPAARSRRSVPDARRTTHIARQRLWITYLLGLSLRP